MRLTKHTKISPVILKKCKVHNTINILSGRSATYAMFSNLTSSPHEDYMVFSDIKMALNEMAIHLPYKMDFTQIISESIILTNEYWEEIVQSYSGLFEVGNDGPPIPLRESANPMLSFNKEEVTRYYEYFGYEVAVDRQWESDHLAIELEYIHFLCQGELGSEDALSFQLAQKDFIDRHFILWLASINHKIKGLDVHPYWIEIFSALYTFIQKDLEWLTTQTKYLKETI